jgi:hypothetical protein
MFVNFQQNTEANNVWKRRDLDEEELEHNLFDLSRCHATRYFPRLVIEAIVPNFLSESINN